MGVDGGGERGQHRGQHQAQQAGRKRLNAAHEARLALRAQRFGGEPRVGRKQDQQRESNRDPQQAAQQDLRRAEDERGLHRVSIAAITG